jgi:hypothetical protein
MPASDLIRSPVSQMFEDGFMNELFIISEKRRYIRTIPGA